MSSADKSYTVKDFVEFLNEDLAYEWAHLEFYLYHSAIVTGLHGLEVREFLTDAAKGELQHVQQFLDCILGLDPYYRPVYGATVVSRVNQAAVTSSGTVLHAAIRMEKAVVDRYAARLEQLAYLNDDVASKYLTVFYEDQLKDSYEDVKRMQRLLQADVVFLA